MMNSKNFKMETSSGVYSVFFGSGKTLGMIEGEFKKNVIRFSFIFPVDWSRTRVMQFIDSIDNPQ